MRLQRLDHVALWVADRDRIAAFATGHLGMRVIERTDAFTLIGSDARRGKLTLFTAEGERERGALVHVAFRVSDLDRAGGMLPTTLGLSVPYDGALLFDVAEGLRLGLVEGDTDVDYDLDHVALLSPDPEAAARAYVPLGFAPAEPGPSGETRVEVGGAFVELHTGDAGETAHPLLNHVAVLVDEAAGAQRLGAEVANVVDAANTYAVFVWGPDRIKIEYVEHKPEFSLS